MNGARKALFLGGFKSALSNACGLIMGLPLADPEHFSMSNVGGWKHLFAAIAFVTISGEARFWKQWADSGHDATPQN